MFLLLCLCFVYLKLITFLLSQNRSTNHSFLALLKELSFLNCMNFTQTFSFSVIGCKNYCLYTCLLQTYSHSKHYKQSLNLKHFQFMLSLRKFQNKGRFKKKKKKVRNFPHFSGVGGFEKVIFRQKKKKYGLKMHKIT